MTTARQVPALVAAHSDFLRTYDYHDYAGKFMQSLAATSTPPNSQATPPNITAENFGEVGQIWCEDEIGFLRISHLFHVSESMVAVARMAGQQVDRAETWSREVLPANNGVLVFEHPLEMLDIWNRKMTVAALTWHRTPPSWSQDHGLILTTYTDVAALTDDYNVMLSRTRAEVLRTHGPWSLAHYSLIRDGSRYGRWVTATDPEYLVFAAEYRSHNGERDSHLHGDEFAPLRTDDLLDPGEFLSTNLDRLLYAIFLMMQQTVVSTNETITDKRMARMARKRKSTPPMVSVIRLRREEQYG